MIVNLVQTKFTGILLRNGYIIQKRKKHTYKRYIIIYLCINMYVYVYEKQ